VGATSAKQNGSDLFSRMVDMFCPPDAHVVGEELHRQYRAVVAFIYIGATIIFGFALLNVKHQNYVAGGVQIASVGVVLAMLFVNRGGHARVSAHVCVAMTTLTIFIGMWMGGGISAAAIVFLPMIPAVGLLSIGQGGGIAGAVQAVGVVALVATMEKLGFEPRHDSPDNLFVKRVAESIVVVVEIWLVCYLFLRLKNDAFAMLSGKRDELAGLFDGMRQGVLAFGADGRVTGQYSHKAKEIFRRERLDGLEVSELLYRTKPAFDLGRQEFVTWLESVFMAGAEELPEMLTFAPEHCVVAEESEDEQHLRLEFRPLLEGSRLVRLMLLVSDETEQVKFKREADRQKELGERALERMRRLAAGGAHAFLETLRAAEARVRGIEQTLEAVRDVLPLAEIDLMFRSAHTVKGEARLYDLHGLASAAERFEDLLTALRTQAIAEAFVPSAQELAQARDLLAEARAEIIAARDKLVEASPIGGAILDQVTVSETDLRALRQQVMRLHMTLGEDVGKLSEVTSRLLSRPFGASATGLVDALDRWSVQQGKRAQLTLVGKEIAIPPELHELLPGVLGHLVRNAIVHGIEQPDDRLRTGKAERGSVSIECRATEHGPEIVVLDDGKGVDTQALEQRARALGLTWNDERPFELMFVDGLSTASSVDALSGRGVGMCAVQSDLSRVGYDIDVSSEPFAGTCFTLRPRARLAHSLGEPENDVTPHSERSSGRA
jgi:signal transduction histidine kinase